jgi:hypothetical protein
MTTTISRDSEDLIRGLVVFLIMGVIGGSDSLFRVL